MAITYIKHGSETSVNVNFVLLEMTALARQEAEAVPRPQNKNTGGDHDISMIPHSHILNPCEDTKINFQTTYTSLEL